MKITEVEGLPLAGSGKQGAYGAPYGLVVRVSTDAGITGYGEADSCPSVVKAIIEAPYHHELMSGLKPLLVGEDPLDNERLWDKMYRGTRGYGRDGAVIQAMAAVDLALWDIKGKEAHLPAHRLLGAVYRDKVTVYATHALGGTLDETARFATRLCDEGFTAVKFGWSPLGEDAVQDAAIVRAIRTAIGTSTKLLIDAGNAWDAPTAIERCRRFGAYDIFWLEEPLGPDDFAGYAKLTDSVGTRIAAGEQASTLGELTRLMEEGRIDIVQVDVSRVGLTQAMKVAHVAERLDVPCVNHTYTLDLNLAASLHFVAAIPKTSLFEYPSMPNDLRDNLVRNRPRPVDGTLAVPQEPGLGVDIDLEALERYLVRA